jgi:hypothetical protein
MPSALGDLQMLPVQTKSTAMPCIPIIVQAIGL